MLLRRTMLALTMGILLTVLPARADEVVRKKVPFYEIFNALQTLTGDPAHPGPFQINAQSSVSGITVSVDHADTAKPVTIPIFSLDNPPVKDGAYTLRGSAAYGGVGGAADLGGVAYLEMWSTFADGSSYFSRTLAGAGPMKKFIGHSVERLFALPFKPNPGMVLTNLTVNLVMTGPGSVTLSDVDGQDALLLVQDEPTAVAPAAGQTAGLDAVARQADALQVDYDTGGRGFRVDEDERRLLEAERRFNEHVLPHGWTQRFTIPLEMDVRTSWWFTLAALVLSAGVIAAQRSAGGAGPVRIPAVLLGLASFGWGMAALGRGLLAGISLAGGGLLLLATAWLVLPLLTRRYQSAELRRMQLLDVA